MLAAVALYIEAMLLYIETMLRDMEVAPGLAPAHVPALALDMEDSGYSSESDSGPELSLIRQLFVLL